MRTLMYRLVTLVSLLLVWANAQKVWVSMPSMITARSDHTATLVGDVIILAGGCVGNQICPPGPEEFCFCEAVTSAAEAYLPAVNDWIKLEDMPRERYRHAAAAVGLKLYVFGGRDLQDSIITEVDVFDTVTRQWATLTNPWTGATSDLSGVAIGTMLYALGGYTLTYDAVNTTATFDTTETDAQWEYGSVAPMYLARGDSCASVIDNNIYLFGGFEYTNFCLALNILEVYNFDTNQWTIETPLHYPRGDSGCAVIGGKFHAIAGEQKDNVTGCSKYDIPINDVEVFDLSSNSWAEETSLPEVRFRFAAASYQDTLFIFGGQGAQHNGTYPVLDSVLSIVDTTASTSQSTVVTMFMALTATCVMLLI